MQHTNATLMISCWIGAMDWLIQHSQRLMKWFGQIAIEP